MAVTPLSRLLEIDSGHTVCFDSDGIELAWPAFVGRVGGIAAALDGRDERLWAVDIDDTGEFAAAVMGCWAAGKTPVLAPGHMLDGSVRVDGVIRSGFADAPAAIADPVIPATAGIVLFTSGSTGEPTRVERTIGNIEAELAVLDALFGDRIGADGRVWSTVSHEHVYGMLFRVFWPLVTRRAVATFNLEYPEHLLSDCASGGALVTSPALLKRIGHLDDADACRWRIIFTSGGLLPGQAARDAARLLGAWPVEILGSTETSGVGWRCQAERGMAATWQALPEVELRQDAEEFLEVRSPFVGQSAWLRMGDRVRLRPNGSFELLGRGDHIVKIEEKRVSLAEIEQRAIELTEVTDAAAVALEEGTRQYVGLVVQLSDSGKAAFELQGRRGTTSALRKALGAHLDPIAVPKKLRYVDTIPVNPQGKRQPGEIRALFAEP